MDRLAGTPAGSTQAHGGRSARTVQGGVTGGALFSKVKSHAKKHGHKLAARHQPHLKKLQSFRSEKTLRAHSDRQAKGGGWWEMLQELFATGKSFFESGKVARSIINVLDEEEDRPSFLERKPVAKPSESSGLSGLFGAGADLLVRGLSKGVEFASGTGAFAPDAPVGGGFQGGSSDAHRDKTREKVRKPLAKPQQLVVGGAVPLRTSFAGLKTAGRKHAERFKGSRKQHLDAIMSIKGHRQLIDHTGRQGAGFSSVLNTLMDLIPGSATGAHDALKKELSGGLTKVRNRIRGLIKGKGKGKGGAFDPQGHAPLRPSAPQAKLTLLHGPPTSVTVQPLRGPMGL